MSEREPPALRVEALGNSRFSVQSPREPSSDDRTSSAGDASSGGNRVAYAVDTPQQTWVWLDGVIYEVPNAADQHMARTRTDDMAMAAPMPATVRAIAVTIGQTVSSGDTLVVLEAMKMELAIKAPRSGVVRAVHCAPGELVQPGVALVELEREG